MDARPAVSGPRNVRPPARRIDDVLPRGADATAFVMRHAGRVASAPTGANEMRALSTELEKPGEGPVLLFAFAGASGSRAVVG